MYDILSEVISDTFEGVTVSNTSFGPVYIKHFKPIEVKRIFSKREIYIDEAVKKGLVKEKVRIDELISEEMWSVESEQTIQEKTKFIENLEASLVKIKLPSQRTQHKKLIDKEKEKLADISRERASLLGMTAEIYVEKKINKEFFEKIIFVDPEYKQEIFETLDYADREKEAELMRVQSEFFQKFSDENVSKAALDPFFAPYLPYCESVMDIYGIPMRELTVFQIKLLSYGRTFLNIFKNCQKQIPEYVQKDPELLMEFYEAQKNNQEGRETKASQGSGGTTYFGANQGDIESIKKSDEKAVSLTEEVSKKGGKLDMKALMAMHGL